MNFANRYTKFIVITVILVIALLFLSTDVTQPKDSNFVDRFLIRISSPVQNGFTTTFDSIASVFNQYIYLTKVYDENIAFQQTIRQLKLKLAFLEELKVENERLRHLLEFKKNTAFPLVSAQIIGWDPASNYRSLRINKGTKAGIKTGMPVLHAFGVVGRILKVTQFYSDVLLITDINSNVSALTQRGRIRGIVVGWTKKLLHLKYISHDADVRIGDRVVTSNFGLRGIFPTGIPVGDITAIKSENNGLEQSVIVTPAVELHRVEEIFVMLKEQDALAIIKETKRGFEQ